MNILSATLATVLCLTYPVNARVDLLSEEIKNAMESFHDGIIDVQPKCEKPIRNCKVKTHFVLNLFIYSNKILINAKTFPFLRH